jgi:hypothetical protein
MTIHDIPIILLTTDSNKKIEIEKELFRRGLSISKVVLTERIQQHAAGVALGHLKCLDIFRPPFLILEDDIRIRNVNFDLNLPKNSDAIYLGISSWGLHNEEGQVNQIEHKSIDNNFTRLYNMLSTHSILYNNELFVEIVKKLCEYSILHNKPFDIELSKIQKYFMITAVKDPYFYQSGYNEYCTNITLS